MKKISLHQATAKAMPCTYYRNGEVDVNYCEETKSELPPDLWIRWS